jgi:hypothetical protein
MNITEEQINACQLLIELEDMYINRIMEDGDSDSIRIKLQPIRHSINSLKETYNIEDDIRSMYDRYTRLMRASIIYKDILDNINNSNDDG